MKKRKFATGGYADNNDSAFGGLNQIGQGASAIGQALQNAQQAIGSPGGGGGVLSQSNQLMQGSNAREMLSGLGLKKGGKVSSASKRGDGIAKRGKTKGRMV